MNIRNKCELIVEDELFMSKSTFKKHSVMMITCGILLFDNTLLIQYYQKNYVKKK